MKEQKFILIEADTNDADYISSCNTITDEEIELLRPIIEIISNCEAHHNWGSGEYCREHESPREVYKNLLTEDQIELMEGYVPHGEYGIHTIESIEIITKLETLL